MKKTAIPKIIKEKIEETVDTFNRKTFQDLDCYYIPRYRGSYLYLDRYDSGAVIQVCRLNYTGAMDQWEFAIFRYSSERYDPDEWFFPGAGFVDGSIEGAMKAGLAAYP